MNDRVRPSGGARVPIARLTRGCDISARYHKEITRRTATALAVARGASRREFLADSIAAINRAAAIAVNESPMRSETTRVALRARKIIWSRLGRAYLSLSLSLSLSVFLDRTTAQPRARAP